MRLRAHAGWLLLGLSALGCHADVVSVGEPEDIIYFAEVRDGGWDRVHILRIDPSTHTCARLALRHDDVTHFYFAVDDPGDWLIEFVRLLSLIHI